MRWSAVNGDETMTDRKKRHETPEIISPAETARTMNVSLPTLWRIRQDPEADFPPAIPLGSRRIGFRRKSVLRWIDERERRARESDARKRATRVSDAQPA